MCYLLTEGFLRLCPSFCRLPFAAKSEYHSIKRQTTHLLAKNRIDNTNDSIKSNIATKPSCKFFIVPEHRCNRSLRTTTDLGRGELYYTYLNLPGSAKPVVSRRIWSKAPLRRISFSMAAAPESLMLQQRHPFANSRISSDCSAVGSSGEETLTVLANNSD